MRRLGRPSGVVAAIVFALSVLPSHAVAQIPTKKHATSLAIHHVGVGASGKVSVTGIVKSKGATCRSERLVQLRIGSDTTGVGVLDIGFSSFPGGAWAARTSDPVSPNAHLFVSAMRGVIHIQSVGSGGDKHERKVVCKKSKRVTVPLPL